MSELQNVVNNLAIKFKVTYEPKFVSHQLQDATGKTIFAAGDLGQVYIFLKGMEYQATKGDGWTVP